MKGGSGQAMTWSTSPYITRHLLFSLAAKLSRVWVYAVNVIGKTNEEPPNFSISFEDDLAVLQDASESNESKRNRKPWKTLRSISNKRCFRTHFPCCVIKQMVHGLSCASIQFWMHLGIIGSLRSYDGNSKENVILKLNFALSLLRLFHVYHVVQNRRSALSFAWHEGFHVKAKNERFTAASSRCRQNLKYENFTSSFERLRQNIAPKSVQHDYFSSFNQSNYWFVTLSLTLPSSNLKLPTHLPPMWSGFDTRFGVVFWLSSLSSKINIVFELICVNC